MNPQDQSPYSPAQYDPNQRISNELSVMQPGERVVCEIKRHPIGIVAVYTMIFIILATIGAVAFGVLPNLAESTGNSATATQIGALVFIFFVVLCAVYAVIATKVYWDNRWVVTSDSVTQITRSSLFNRQSSQLAMHSIEDVTAEQNGILAQLFHYGVLKAETAGKRAKFVFNFCPNPNFYAKQILDARETYQLGMHKNDMYGAGGPYPQQQPPAGPPQAY